MQFNNFLADIYFGHLNKDIFHGFKDSKDDDHTRNFIEHYLEISQQYPPRQLEADGRVSSELLEKLKTIGFFGLNISSTYGGAGLSLRRYLKVVEVVATQSLALGFTSLAHLSIGVKGIALFGNEQQKQHYLPKAASGEMIFSYALTEPKRGSDAKHIESTATLSDDGEYYILNGSKAYITNANYAQAMTVFAQMDPQHPGFMGAFIVIPLILSVRKMVNDIHISEVQQRELKELAEKERSRLAALLSAMNIGILFEDKQNCVEYINPAFKSMWALNEDKLLTGRSLNQLLDESPHRFASPEHSSKYVLQVLDTHEISERFEINFKDGRTLTQLSYPVLDNEKSVLGRLWVYEDITHDQQTAQQLLYLAEHDTLTGLFNRHRFQKHLAFMLESYRRTNGKFALLYFDLDEFKYINDTFGHGAGDSILLQTASEVNHLVRGAEMFARLGGDEFAILTTLGPDDKLGALPERIIGTMSSIPFRFRGTNIRLTASLGVAVFPEHGDNADDLVAHADTAAVRSRRRKQ